MGSEVLLTLGVSPSFGWDFPLVPAGPYGTPLTFSYAGRCRLYVGGLG